MKKRNILNLIKYHVEKNDSAFRNESISIARYFDSIGDLDLAEYILGLLSELPTFSPQTLEVNSEYLEQLDTTKLEPLHLPIDIINGIGSIISAVKRNIGINKFLFMGESGTGKTEAAKQVARLLNRNFYKIDLKKFIDSNVENTNINIINAFHKMYHISDANQRVILFEEIDALVRDRAKVHDIIGMESIMSTLIGEIDSLSSLHKDIVLIVTINRNNDMEQPLLRKFNFTVNFNRYAQEDLIEICEFYCDSFVAQFKGDQKAIRLLRKILSSSKNLPYPGELKHIVKTAIAFSDVSSEYDYLKRLYDALIDNLDSKDISDLYQEGFTIREIEILKGISKSTVSRKLRNR